MPVFTARGAGDVVSEEGLVRGVGEFFVEGGFDGVGGQGLADEVAEETDGLGDLLEARIPEELGGFGHGGFVGLDDEGHEDVEDDDEHDEGDEDDVEAVDGVEARVAGRFAREDVGVDGLHEDADAACAAVVAVAGAPVVGEFSRKDDGIVERVRKAEEEDEENDEEDF